MPGLKMGAKAMWPGNCWVLFFHHQVEVRHVVEKNMLVNGWLMGILGSWCIVIPTKLGSINPSYTLNKQVFFLCSSDNFKVRRFFGCGPFHMTVTTYSVIYYIFSKGFLQTFICHCY